MSTPVLNSSFLVREHAVELSSDLNSIHLKNLISSAPDDMGVIDIWAQANRAETPLYNLAAFKGKNEVMVQDPKGRWTYKVPVEFDLPYVVDDVDNTNVQKGIAGTTFRIKLDRKMFTHGEIITYDKFNGAELFVTQDDIIDAGDGFIYTVRLVNNDTYRYFDNRFLTSGTKFFSKSSLIGEKTSRFPGMSERVGYREYENYVGGGEAGFEFTVDRMASMLDKFSYKTRDGRLNAVQLFKVPETLADPSVRTFDDLARKMGMDNLKKAIKEGVVQMSFITKLEQFALSKISKDIENYLMWGQGGIVPTGSPEISRMSTGLWAQTNNSFKTTYTKDTFTLEFFRSQLRNFLGGRVPLDGPDPNRKIVVQTGQGGFELINKAILSEASSMGFMIAAAENQGIGAIRGQGLDLEYGFYFTKYTIPFLANVQFVVNPALDNWQMVNDTEMPLIDGFPLSSYSFLIFDITSLEGSNIKLLKYGPDHQLSWYYRNGTIDYLGKTSGFQSTGDDFGFILKMRQRHPAIWVQDPTKILKIVMKNPITGGSL